VALLDERSIDSRCTGVRNAVVKQWHFETSMWLNQLAVGGKARVTSIVGADEVSTRLLEMGLTPGAVLTILGTAPLGDPIELELRGYRLSIRKSEAARIEVAAL
jgi:ferrous iron transport protein A